LLITNDTAVSHIAAALHVPSVIVFTDSDPDRWAPLDKVLHRALVSRSAETNHCVHQGISAEHHCLADPCTASPPAERQVCDELSAESVIAEAMPLLREVAA